MRNKPEKISNLDWNLLCQKYDNLEEVIAKIDEGYPIAYLIGDVSFYGYPFKVNENVLIPRFETETLIEKTIKLIKSLNLENSNLIDLGTGSGVIAITLKKEIPSLNITAIDKSKEALKVAIENSKLNKVNVDFQNQDIFNYKLHVLYEPKEAIFVSNTNPLIYYEQILKMAKEKITKKHLISFEIDEDHKENMYKLCKKYFPSDNIVIEKDLAGKNRYAFIYSE